MRIDIAYIIKHNNLLVESQKEVKTRNELTKDDSLAVVKADKNSETWLMNTIDYNNVLKFKIQKCFVLDICILIYKNPYIFIFTVHIDMVDLVMYL